MRKFDCFCRALDNLQEIESRRPPYDIITLTGLVGLYQICFEQSWKAIKEVMEKRRDYRRRNRLPTCHP